MRPVRFNGETTRPQADRVLTLDSIFVRNLTVLCKVGVSDRERRRGQEIIADLTVYCDLRKAGVRDDIRETVSYSELKESVFEFISEGEFRLLEAVAEGVALRVLKNRVVRKVTVAIRKKRFARDPAVGVEITRLQNG